jgi:release factor glutamine methyltransferase
LFAGPQGLDDYRRLAPVIPRLLAPGGLAAVEIGADQHDSAADLFRAAGCAPRLARDLAGRPRALLIECSRR